MSDISTRQFLLRALDKHPEWVESAPLIGELRRTARKNEKRPAYMQIYVDDDVVKTITGGVDKATHYYYILKVDKRVAERMESRIIMPGDE